MFLRDQRVFDDRGYPLVPGDQMVFKNKKMKSYYIIFSQDALHLAVVNLFLGQLRVKKSVEYAKILAATPLYELQIRVYHFVVEVVRLLER
jgi:hypothetical protein